MAFACRARGENAPTERRDAMRAARFSENIIEASPNATSLRITHT
jgi:hypothetical protein